MGMLRIMSDAASILVVAATARELRPAEGWRTLVCGVGPVEAAATTAEALAAARPRAVVHVGIAGARTGCGIPLLTPVLATESIYCDLAVPEDWAPHRITAPAALLRALQRALPDAVSLPVGTSARVGASTGCDVEAMEGFGVLRAAQRAGIPAVEVRVISNTVEESDRALWRFDDAFAMLRQLTPRLVTAACEVIDDA